MSHGSGVLDQRLGIAQRHGDGAQLQLVQSVGNGVAVGLQFNGHHAAVQLHLLLGDLVALEVLQAGIIDLVDGGMIMQEPSNLHGVGAVTLHTDVQRLEAAGNQESVEGAHDGTGHVLQAEHAALADKLSVGDDEARNDVAVAVDVLGSAVDDHVSTQAQGLLDVGRAEGVIHDHADVLVELVSELSDLSNVNNFQSGVAGGLQIDDLGLLGQSGFHGSEIGEVHELHADAELGHAMVQQSEGAAIQCVAGNDLVAALNGAPQSGGDSAHAGSGSQSSLAAFESRQLLLDLGQRGVGQTRVDVALFLTGEAGAALLHGIKLEGRGLINRGTQCADTVVVLTGVNLTSSEAHVLAIHNKCLPFLVPGPVRPANFVVIVFQLSVRTFSVSGKRRERVE